MDWVKIFENLSAFAIASGVFALLIRSLFTILINKDFEKFKLKLSKEQIRFTKLHEKRGEVIENIYALLVDFEGKMNSLLSPFQPAGEPKRKEKLKIAGIAGNKFIEYYGLQKIFFSKKTVNLLDELHSRFRKAWIDFTTYPITDFDEWESVTIKQEKWKLWEKAWKAISEDIPLLKVQLEDEFRSMLGVENSD